MMPVTGDGVERNALHLPMEETITREIERIDFDFCILAGDDKPNVAVRNHCLNFEFAVARDDDHCPAGERHYRRAIEPGRRPMDTLKPSSGGLVVAARR